MQEKGILLVLSGPSGAGKGTICKYLLAHNPSLKYSISATTRAPRTGELNGQSYHFVSKDTFQEMIAQDELLEHAEVYGNYYGTPKNYVQKLLDENLDVILEIDPQGAMQIKNKFPEAVFVLILPPSLTELSDRIYKRGTDTAEVIRHRLSKAVSELKFCASKYDYLVINDEVNKASDKILAIITSEKCRVGRNMPVVEEIICNNN
ncbi:guanylate kinase [Succinispira mobilis]|uniref:guanylate kinase n=1 Tax=Succinispira mobilis TaxID=78120 RepID=UPI00037E904C|nr:guanylate kinase [Succinispira mobilis]